MDGTAIVVCDDLFATPNAKTAHGLVRGSERYRILGVIDGPTAGRDAGEALDGVRRGIPAFASITGALRALPTRPDFCVVGVATSGGRVTPGLRGLLSEAIEAGLSVVNGLHEFLSDDPGLADAAARHGVTIRDVRKTPPRNVLHSIPNDFVSGELEHAVVSCWDERRPELILLEGQSALRNPSGPCGSEFLLSGGARGVILQHAPGRIYFDGEEELGSRIPSVE